MLGDMIRVTKRNACILPWLVACFPCFWKWCGVSVKSAACMERHIYIYTHTYGRREGREGYGALPCYPERNVDRQGMGGFSTF